MVVVAATLVGCKGGDLNKIREAFGAKAEASEEDKTLGDVASETGSDAKEGIDEKLEELDEESSDG